MPVARGGPEARHARPRIRQAGAVARGDRPAYRVTTAEDGRWRVDTLPWVPVTATGRREALDEARAAIAEWREVPLDAFYVEA